MLAHILPCNIEASIVLALTLAVPWLLAKVRQLWSRP